MLSSGEALVMDMERRAGSSGRARMSNRGPSPGGDAWASEVHRESRSRYPGSCNGRHIGVAAIRVQPGLTVCPVAEFEVDLKNNLHRIWNPMPSGTYFPPPVNGSVDTEAAWAWDKGSRVPNLGLRGSARGRFLP